MKERERERGREGERGKEGEREGGREEDVHMAFSACLAHTSKCIGSCSITYERNPGKGRKQTLGVSVYETTFLHKTCKLK